MLMDYAFQNIIFSMVNIKQIHKLNNLSEVLSYIVSSVYLVLYLTMIISLLKILRNHFQLSAGERKDLSI